MEEESLGTADERPDNPTLETNQDQQEELDSNVNMDGRRGSTFGLFDRRNSSGSSYGFRLRRSSSSVTASSPGATASGYAQVNGGNRRNSSPGKSLLASMGISGSGAGSSSANGGSKGPRKDRWRILARKVLGNVSEQDEEIARDIQGIRLTNEFYYGSGGSNWV